MQPKMSTTILFYILLRSKMELDDLYRALIHSQSSTGPALEALSLSPPLLELTTKRSLPSFPFTVGASLIANIIVPIPKTAPVSLNSKAALTHIGNYF